MENTLTIIKNTQSLPLYPVTALPPDVHEAMVRAGDKVKDKCYQSKLTTLIKIFDAYCHVTGTHVTYLSLSSSAFEKTVRGFLGALDDESIIPGARDGRYAYARAFVKLLDKMRDEIPLLPVVQGKSVSPKKNLHIWEAMKPHVDPVALRYWNGWEIHGRKQRNSYLPMAHLWNSHGPEFAELVFDTYKKYSEKKSEPSHTEFNALILFISSNCEKWPASAFQHPVKIKRLFIEFMLDVFMRAYENEVNIKNKSSGYSNFIYDIDAAFIQSGVWARPFSGQLPKPVVKNTPGTHTNHKKKKDGTIVVDKLITEIPLHITDSNAIELLFKKINEDNALVLQWARNRLAKAKEAYDLYRELSKEGVIITGGNKSAQAIEEIGVANVCATYAAKGITYFKKGGTDISGQVSKVDIFNVLSIPTTDTFFAVQMLLVHAHPCITDSFFEFFKLHDKLGNVSGFKKTDVGHQLVGYKNRKGGSLSEQKIDLTEEEAGWVQLLISLTKPLSDELRAAGDDTWRYLFLHTCNYITTPSRSSPMKLNRKTIDFQKRMISEFMEVGGLDEEAAKAFIVRLSVTAFRASAAVEIYLRDHSVEEMARALGHTRYSSALLSRYLPQSILAFFQTRWIRIFQRGIICQAMKGSTRLLEAARFENMEEFHEFLKNHALQDIPEHLQNPDYLNAPAPTAASKKSKSKTAGQVVVSIDPGVLTALLSLNAAVKNATQKTELGKTSGAQLCSKAIYWSRFSDLVVKEIEDGFNSELQAHLEAAQKHSNASHMEELIYATAS